MKIVIFNVGPALSAYVEMGSNKIVVDLGKGNDFSMVNDFLLPLFKKRGELKNSSNKYYLNQVFISHPHLDHISDLDDLDKHFYINLFTTPNDLSKGRESYKNINWDLVDDADSKEVKKIKEVYKGRNLPLRVCDPSRMTISYIYPSDVENDTTLKNESYTNNVSIALYIHTGYKIFFAADIQKEGMKKLLEDNPELEKKLGQGVDFLVCPHHGLRSSFSTELFGAMKDGKTKKLNIISEKVNGDDNRNVDSRYASTNYCEGDNNLSTDDNIVCQRKTSQGHIFIDDDGTVTIEKDIQKIIKKFC
ncbi:MBL fold metallo-hydrolase [Phocaeicola vulgatus]|nr:MBL fold metallo-hydrolase [Phocaeicola vulgatus]